MLGFGEDDKKEVATDEKHEDKAGMAKVRTEDKKDEGKKEEKHDLVAEQKASVEKMEKASEKEKADTKHIRTGGRDTHHDLLPELGVQVVTDEKSKVTKALPFVDTEVDHDRAVKVDEKK